MVDTRAVFAADSAPGDWLTHGRTYSEQRFSPLTSIDTATVANLGLAWSYQLKTPRGAEATPLVIDGVMYLTSAWSLVYALDAATGKELWVYDPKIDRALGARMCCDAVNRGVAAYGDKIYLGAIDGRLVALRAKDGSVAWEKVTIDQSKPYTITGAPRAANGLVYIGNGGADYGVRGYVSAYDAETGALRWRFYTVPGDPSKGPDGAASDAVMARAAATWNGEWWRLGGGGTVWDAIVYDPEFDQLIIGTGNGSPWNRELRSPGGGDNLFLSSIVALEARSGAYKWHYQATPGDSWGYGATQQIILAELQIGGALRKVAMQAPKNGFFYLIDRADGRLISAKPFLPVLASAQTQPGYPISWAYAVDSLTGRPVENPEARYQARATFIRPGPFGAHNWPPMSYSPATGLVYIPTQDHAIVYAGDSAFTPRDGVWNLGIAPLPFPDDKLSRAVIKQASVGFLLAWDPVSQREMWRAPRAGMWNGGTLATAGGLVFQGTVDGKFLALNAANGSELWAYDNQAATMAGPITYEADGEQYVAVLGGYGSSFFLAGGFLAPKPGESFNGLVYAFKLGGKAPKPAVQVIRVPIPEPPEIEMSEAEYSEGGSVYARFCQMCHGLGAISGGQVPDLRKSLALRDTARWNAAILGGELASQGMPGFAKYLPGRGAELLRGYVARQAAMAYRGEQGFGKAARW
ncbi:MAG: PQQ-dependent dehydrogenase, methanol/ethanol family [Gemmatimonadales bacterium]|nr:PQQ-dependent dehydrogenase, methanol/ethanol family [Gemmatimonadales bacterium]